MMTTAVVLMPSIGVLLPSIAVEGRLCNSTYNPSHRLCRSLCILVLLLLLISSLFSYLVLLSLLNSCALHLRSQSPVATGINTPKTHNIIITAMSMDSG